MNNNLPNKISCPNKRVATEVVDCSKIDLGDTTTLFALYSLCDIVMSKHIRNDKLNFKRPQKCKPKVMRSIWEDVCVVSGISDEYEISALYQVYDANVNQSYNSAELLEVLKDYKCGVNISLVHDIFKGFESLCDYKKMYSHNQWKRLALQALKSNPELLNNVAIDLKEIVDSFENLHHKVDRAIVEVIANYLDNKVEEMKLIKYKKICDINTNGSSILNIVDSRNVVRELHTISTNGDSPLVLEYIDYSSLFELLENGSTLNEHRNLNFVEGSLSEFLIGDMILQLNFNRREHNLEEVVRSF